MAWHPCCCATKSSRQAGSYLFQSDWLLYGNFNLSQPGTSYIAAAMQAAGPYSYDHDSPPPPLPVDPGPFGTIVWFNPVADIFDWAVLTQWVGRLVMMQTIDSAGNIDTAVLNYIGSVAPRTGMYTIATRTADLGAAGSIPVTGNALVAGVSGLKTRWMVGVNGGSPLAIYNGTMAVAARNKMGQCDVVLLGNTDVLASNTFFDGTQPFFNNILHVPI